MSVFFAGEERETAASERVYVLEYVRVSQARTHDTPWMEGAR